VGGGRFWLDAGEGEGMGGKGGGLCWLDKGKSTYRIPIVQNSPSGEGVTPPRGKKRLGGSVFFRGRKNSIGSLGGRKAYLQCFVSCDEEGYGSKKAASEKKQKLLFQKESESKPE